MNEMEETLLNRYVDNECGFFERQRARRLIDRSEEARNYIESLKKLREGLIISLPIEKPHADLWPRVSMRIAQEENAAVFLGERKFEERRSPFTLPSLGFAFGSVVTAIFLFSIWIPSSQSIGSGVASSGTASSSPLTLASTAGEHQAEGAIPLGRPQIINEPFQSVIDVDWMRSTGRVRILQNPEDRSAIIWVRKKKQLGDANSSESSGRSVQLPEDMFPRNRE